MKNRPYTHPGIILKEDFAIPLKLTQAKIAGLLNVGVKTINEIYNEKRGITPLMALKLSCLLGTTPEFWMNLQSNYDLSRTYAKQKDEIDSIKKVA